MYLTINVRQPEEWFTKPLHRRSRSIEALCRERMVSVRTCSVLNALGIRSTGDLCRLRIKDLREARNCGKVTIREVEKLMKLYGLTLE